MTMATSWTRHSPRPSSDDATKCETCGRPIRQRRLRTEAAWGAAEEYRWMHVPPVPDTVRPMPFTVPTQPLTRLEPDEAKSLIGEGIHTALRKVGSGLSAAAAWDAIDRMNPHEWDDVLKYVVDGLGSVGIYLVRDARGNAGGA